ncbi:hypothetical protein PPERSA_11521 [Pseudocohnilembus persalinus]|uniref:Uncharacterized protein n=1 Tax=Pseudocohnilembus persalinus TaxID=266149 RepID=A0A0V0QWY3_PSEPJ|nr:hypothetical protein PPERSA_11521 [Pseudocohnilembus persalinus]|eukprot:KRX06876.1 hypothetical protein PPERSA_11521 [Pseudocohnilembus persalinus]
MEVNKEGGLSRQIPVNIARMVLISDLKQFQQIDQKEKLNLQPIHISEELETENEFMRNICEETKIIRLQDDKTNQTLAIQKSLSQILQNRHTLTRSEYLTHISTSDQMNFKNCDEINCNNDNEYPQENNDFVSNNS